MSEPEAERPMLLTDVEWRRIRETGEWPATRQENPMAEQEPVQVTLRYSHPAQFRFEPPPLGQTGGAFRTIIEGPRVTLEGGDWARLAVLQQIYCEVEVLITLRPKPPGVL